MDNTIPESEVIHPMNHPTLQGFDKIGALLITNENKAWWTGSVMDHVDAKQLFDGKFGPTVLQVASGVYAGFRYMMENPQIGTNFADYADTKSILKFVFVN